MKKIMLFILSSIVAYAQQDTVITTKNVVKFGDKFFIETKTISFQYKELNTELMRSYEAVEEEKKRSVIEQTEKERQRREYVKLLKDAIKAGYVPISDNDFDDKLYKRVLDKVKKEKL